MKIRAFFLFLLILAVSGASVIAVSAQDIDIDNMDKEQLTILLEQILQKLQTDETDTESLSEQTETVTETVIAIAEKTPEPVREVKTFQVYENKKLIIERLPDELFIREKPGGGEDENDSEDHSCPPGQNWVCNKWGCDCYYPNG